MIDRPLPNSYTETLMKMTFMEEVASVLQSHQWAIYVLCQKQLIILVKHNFQILILSQLTFKSGIKMQTNKRTNK